MKKSNVLNKEEFVSFIADKNDCSKAEAGRALNMIKDAIMAAMKKGHDIALVGFGTFHIRHRAARKGHIPKTGKEITIPASKLPAFKAGKQLKDACN